ncbi:hypothetical protein [Paracoccus sp. (in: a-proteobacteria)]|uniref:hypothetical protein n=1 Tax=Paracoccus sp. TaxID=267 RepID=UPI00289C2188|nr:hypothetical protein [Paracoccus sp. (in: a-proteobacteria)]
MSRILSLIVMVWGALTSQALAADRHITFTNNTGGHIEALFGSNEGSKSWEEDLLGDATLAPDDELTVNFDDGSGYCKFDFKAVYADGSEGILSGVDVCSETEISIE